MSWSLEDLKYILKNIFSITFSNDNQQRRNMYFEACHCTKNLIFFLQIFWYFFFLKIWFWSLDAKEKVIFLKKTRRNMMCSSNVLKRWSFPKIAQEYDPSCNMWKYNISCFPKIWKIYFFLHGKWKMIFLMDTWKYDILCTYV